MTQSMYLPLLGGEDGTFGFSFFEYYEDINEFITNATKAMDIVKSSVGINLNATTERIDLILFFLYTLG